MKNIILYTFIFVNCISLLKAEKFRDFEVDNPSEEYRWQFAGDVDNTEVKSRNYVCTNKLATNRIVLSVTELERTTYEDKKVWFAGQYNGLAKTVENGGFKVLEVQKPDIDTLKIEKEVVFGFDCLASDGKKVFMKSAVIFLKKTYSFMVFAETNEEAEKLFELRRTLKEIDNENNSE